MVKAKELQQKFKYNNKKQKKNKQKEQKIIKKI